VPLWSLPIPYRLLAALPAIFLAVLFFLDQNITVRTVNSADNKLVRRATYHLDLLVLALLTGLSSLCGLPWMCAATVESINHIRSLVTTKDALTSRKDGGDSPPPQMPGAAGSTGGSDAAAASTSPPPVPERLRGELKSEPPRPPPLTSRRLRRSLARALVSPNAAVAFDEADKDGSGAISPEELVVKLKRLSEQKLGRPMSNEQAATMAQEAFRTFDGNSKGELALEEFAEWYIATGLDESSVQERSREQVNGDA
jgi:hypothetical protein